MTPEQYQAVLDHVFFKRISYAELVERSGLDPVARPDIVESTLRDAIVALDAAAVEAALAIAFRFDLLTADLAPLLAILLLLPWHSEHEDIASALQDLRVAATADALAQAALVKHDYLDADDSHPFARKCIWALADIGTPEARAHLERLARTDDVEIAGYARRRLDQWRAELGRKGPGPDPRPEKMNVVQPVSRTTYSLDGNAFATLEEFAQHFSEKVLAGHPWRGNLDAFNDILRGGFGTPEDGFVLVWRDHDVSAKSLGPELFDALLEIIRDHGEGGSQAEDGVKLVLA